MDQRLQWLTVLSLTFCLAAAASADWREYRVSAWYPGLQDWSLPKDQDYPDRAKLEKNLKNGFTTEAPVQVFVSESYTQLSEPSPDWQNGKFLPRIHGWHDNRYFCAMSKLGTIGTKATLEQHIPLGQRLLLASQDVPEMVFLTLQEKGRLSTDGLAEINESKTQKVVVEGSSLSDYFLAGDEWIKIGSHRLLSDGSLSLTRLRPNGSTVTEQVWSKPIELSGKADAQPLWETWKIGSSVRDLRSPGLSKALKWQGPDAEPLQDAGGMRQASSLKTAWLIPGAVLFLLGIGMVAVNTIWRPKPKGK